MTKVYPQVAHVKNPMNLGMVPASGPPSGEPEGTATVVVRATRIALARDDRLGGGIPLGPKPSAFTDFATPAESGGQHQKLVAVDAPTAGCPASPHPLRRITHYTGGGPETLRVDHRLRRRPCAGNAAGWRGSIHPRRCGCARSGGPVRAAYAIDTPRPSVSAEMVREADVAGRHPGGYRWAYRPDKHYALMADFINARLASGPTQGEQE